MLGFPNFYCIRSSIIAPTLLISHPVTLSPVYPHTSLILDFLSLIFRLPTSSPHPLFIQIPWKVETSLDWLRTRLTTWRGGGWLTEGQGGAGRSYRHWNKCWTTETYDAVKTMNDANEKWWREMQNGENITRWPVGENHMTWRRWKIKYAQLCSLLKILQSCCYWCFSLRIIFPF